MQNKIIKISQFLTIIGIVGVIYLLNSILLGINTLNAIQNDQRAIASETRDSNWIMACDDVSIENAPVTFTHCN